MTEYNISDLITDTSTGYGFTAAYDGTDYTIYSNAFFVSEILHLFSGRKILLSAADDETAAEELLTLHSLWCANRSDNYGRRMYALSLDYAPLQNYDSTETREGETNTEYGKRDTTTHGETVGTTYGHTDTTVTTDATATTRTGSVTSAHNIYGVNSTAAVGADTDTDTYNNLADTHSGTLTAVRTEGGIDTVTHGGTDVIQLSGTDSTEDAYTLRRYGNIGVTTSQQMLESDLDLLRRDIAAQAVAEFADRYTYYNEGVEL